MNRDYRIKFSEVIRDRNIDDYVKSEMCKSMISSIGVPKGFHRSNISTVIPPALLNAQPSEPKMIRSKTSRLLNLGRMSTSKLRQTDLESHKKASMIEKIRVPCNKLYYEKIPIKPGFFFFDALLRVPRGKFSDLKINIPESIYYKDKIFYIHTLEDGSLECRNDVYGYRFSMILEKYRPAEDRTIYDRIATIARTCGNDTNDMNKYIMDWGQFNIKMSANEIIQYSLLQRFIHTAGNRPAVTRLHYYSHNRENKANYAYFINSLSDEINKTYPDLQSCVVDTQNPNNIEFFIKSGKAIRYYEEEAKKIVKYLNKGYNIRIEKIVLDFITDVNGKIWLSGCKGIEIDESTLSGSLKPVLDWWNSSKKPEIEKKEENQYLMNFVHCKLCRLYYTNTQLNHLVSVRMLMRFKSHSLQRGELPLDTSHLKVISNDMLSQSVRICEYCYMLVTSEFELISVEEALASALNIPINEIAYEEDPKIQVQKHFLPKRLTQYRLLIFVNKIYEFNFKPNYTNLHLHIKFGEILTTFKLTFKRKEENNEEVLITDLLKVHYILTGETRSISKLTSSELLEIKLTNSDKYNEKTLGITKAQCLADLPSVMSVGEALFSKKQVFLFNNSDSVIGNLAIYFGLSCDKVIESSSVKFVLNKIYDFYIPDFHYMSADPLPVEWLELFGKDVELDESFGNRLEDSHFYRPAMTLAEMLRMEDITSPYKAIPQIYKEKKIEEPKQFVSPGVSVFNVVSDYLTVQKVRHAKRKSWSGSGKKSGRTSATSRATPFKKGKVNYYNEILD